MVLRPWLLSLLKRLRFLQKAAQRVQLLLPERAIVLDPVGGGAHRGGHEVAAVDPPVLAARQETRPLQDAEMLGDRGQRH